MPPAPVDQARLDAFLGKFVGDLGATLHATTVLVGAKLGLYKSLALGPKTSAELAQATGTAERYVREWLAAQAASGYAQYDPATQRYDLSPEQAMALADESSPAYVPGAYLIAASMFKDEPQIAAAFRSGEGMGWHEHHADLFHGTEQFFRPGYVANLVSSWLPSLDGVVAKLERGARVADVGCGHGVTTVLMAQKYPRSHVVGFDYHAPSIERARQLAREAGVADRVTFEVATASKFPGQNYDLVSVFDCLHDMGDPVAAARHVCQSLAADGTWLIVEPMASDRLEENFNPVGRVFFSASTHICCPASLAQDGQRALGAQAGEARIREVVTQGGFTRLRRATQTPFNLILEARK